MEIVRCVRIDEFKTKGHKYEIRVYEESPDHLINTPHFHVICIEGEINADGIMLIPRPESDLASLIDLAEDEKPAKENLIPYNKDMKNEIVLSINTNMYLSHYSNAYFAGKHPILASDREFIDKLNECLNKEVTPNGQTNWDMICIFYKKYFINLDDGWYMFSEKCPTYTKDMVFIFQ